MDGNVGAIGRNQHILETRMRDLSQQILERAEAMIAEIPRAPGPAPSPLAIAPGPPAITVSDYAVSMARLRIDGGVRELRDHFNAFKREVRAFQLTLGLPMDYYVQMPEPRTNIRLPQCLIITPEKEPKILELLELAITDQDVKGNQVRRLIQEVAMETDDTKLAALEPKQIMIPSEEVFEWMIGRLGHAVSTYPDGREQNNPNYVYDCMEQHIAGRLPDIVGIWKHDAWRMALGIPDKVEHGETIPGRPCTLAELLRYSRTFD
jgi:hypothetical protein